MINQERLLDTFLHLVQIDNPSGQEAAMAQYVMTWLRGEGFEAQQDAKGNVLAQLPGQGAPLLLSGHLDSVAPAVGKQGVVRDGVVYSAGPTVLGADDLAGVAAIMEAVRAVREAGRPYRAAEIVFSVEEEIGLRGAKALDWSMITAKEGVALDLNGEVGGICVAAPAQDTLRVTIHGKAAHAGVAPEQGINAIRVAAEAIAAMPLGRIDAETTANIGTISGGAAKNIVPDRVELLGEARSRNAGKLAAQVDQMRQAFEAAAQRHGASVDVVVTHEYGVQLIDPEAPIVQLCQAAARQAGLTPTLIETGGGSDVNIYTMHGISAVNLSVGYRDIHSTDEHIAVESIVKTARLVAALLQII
ncbi:MAG: M20/M25/M40 family metallo-hydrolase [Herpetosiphonaceae bacterium]|nr:M20/M25/M40 family metallo-hydrolase [Herpetosiphonaceae bacterium]